MQDVPYGLCHCGCGQRTPIAKRTSAQVGAVKGQPKKWVPGHAMRKGWRWAEEDRGFATPCWIWQLASNQLGYGLAGLGGGRQAGAHRVVYEKLRGPIPEGKILDHLCRVPACVNPDHLEPVTNAENAHRGISAKLNWETVREIRSSPETNAELSRRLRISDGQISKIRSGQQWREEEAA
jgi:hypothetical protein